MVSDGMRQLEERHLANKVELIVWSNKMDLLALSNSKGEVCLHRLNWQRAWILAPPSEDVKVDGIAWRPDGKVIAIAYSIDASNEIWKCNDGFIGKRAKGNNVKDMIERFNEFLESGEVFLVNVENKEIFHKVCYKANDVGMRITHLIWIEDKQSNMKTDAKYFQESAHVFLPKLPPMTRNLGSISEHESEEDLEDLKLVSDQTSLNFLLVGVSAGFLGVIVFGIVPCGNLHLPDHLKTKGKIVSAEISVDLKYIFVTVEVEGSLKLLIYDSSILNNHSRELFNVAYKYCMFISLIDYLKGIMDNISEFYENMLLLEMEAKWSKYSECNPDSSLSADFLELLVFGVMSIELDKFLSKDLTEKGIQKLGNSIEISHYSIQKLILTHLQAVCTNIVFHLSDFRNMARLTERYQILGIEEEAVSKTFREVGAFMLKADELQLVIDSSLKKYKAFFKWITSILSRLTDDKMSDNSNSVSELSQQETNCIAEYLYSLDTEAGGNTCKQYWLDKVGQYLLDKNLTETIDECKSNFWQNFVNSNSCLLGNENIILRDEKLSLVQQMNKLLKVMSEMIKGMRDAVGKSATAMWEGDIGPSGIGSISSVSISPNNVVIVFNRADQLHIVKVDPSESSSSPKIVSTRTSFVNNTLALKVVDLQFYVESTIALLLEEADNSRSALFLQLPIASIRDSGIKDISRDLASAGRKIENMVGGKLAVSGSRKVAVIVSENRHKVRTYETEIEEDEDEEDMDLISTPHHSSNNTSLDQSLE